MTIYMCFDDVLILCPDLLPDLFSPLGLQVQRQHAWLDIILSKDEIYTQILDDTMCIVSGLKSLWATVCNLLPEPPWLWQQKRNYFELNTYFYCEDAHSQIGNIWLDRAS